MVGIDVFYFMFDDMYYLFGGIKCQLVGELIIFVNVGIGKYWDLFDMVKVIIEIVIYYDFGEDYNDYSVKVGVSILFGKLMLVVF